jgi:hypothetical protein
MCPNLAKLVAETGFPEEFQENLAKLQPAKPSETGKSLS